MAMSASAPSTSPEGAVAALAVALERLVARVTQDLDPDVGEGAGIADPAWAATHAEVVAVARECAVALDDPTVVDTLLAR